MRCATPSVSPISHVKIPSTSACATSDTNPQGVNFTANVSGNITHIFLVSGDASTGCRVYNVNASDWVGGLNGTKNGTSCDGRWEMIAGNTYYLMAYMEALDLGTASGRLAAYVVAALANFERDRIRERTLLGLARVRAQGKRIGRPPRKRGG